MSWDSDLLSIAEWAMHNQDLRHKFLFSRTAADLSTTPGISEAMEISVVLAIYEAAIAKGYLPDETIGYEYQYPEKRSCNPKRADLAFKDLGVGKNWGYVEVKYYDGNGKAKIEKDIEKLKSISTRAQRWILVYRVRAIKGRSRTTKSLLETHFQQKLNVIGERSFSTITNNCEPGLCEIVLSRLL